MMADEMQQNGLGTYTREELDEKFRALGDQINAIGKRIEQHVDTRIKQAVEGLIDQPQLNEAVDESKREMQAEIQASEKRTSEIIATMPTQFEGIVQSAMEVVNDKLNSISSQFQAWQVAIKARDDQLENLEETVRPLLPRLANQEAYIDDVGRRYKLMSESLAEWQAKIEKASYDHRRDVRDSISKIEDAVTAQAKNNQDVISKIDRQNARQSEELRVLRDAETQRKEARDRWQNAAVKIGTGVLGAIFMILLLFIAQALGIDVSILQPFLGG